MTKISDKFRLIFLVIMAVAIANVSVVYYFSALQKTDAAVVDAAGRDRMLSQRIGFYSEQVISGDEDAKKTLESLVSLHNISFYALKDGGVAPDIADNMTLPLATPGIMPLVLRAESLWLEYAKNAETIVNKPTLIDGKVNPEVSAAMSFIEQNAPDMLQRNDEMVKAYVEMNSDKQARLNEALLILFTASALTISSGFFISRSISKNIAKLTKTVEDISLGNFDAEIDPKIKKSHDELGYLANAFDRTLVSLRLSMKKNSSKSKEEDFHN